jgi:hypothetical protein
MTMEKGGRDEGPMGRQGSTHRVTPFWPFEEILFFLDRGPPIWIPVVLSASLSD